ncbi:hypothetical protein EDD37DRAFT_250839 [Exophiala viscosa]|uniref:YetF C-terminal domain-containing protein n=1 Tax=Exophiala viscosa TaxID=2486360 RepID=A0AAN6E5S9_9EURO|nr:hypothetical protein EDD36DRAFT_18567 [Exophiala viscosa]KAI1627111.1 hypothetical protein EDD37DRAFT_250839 [Exophiala viscosa]
MSGTSTSGTNGTVVISGPDVVQTSDFYVKAGILHPVTIGSIAVIALFAYLRLGSNRSIAPITIFDWLINVALGSTLAGIVNGNSLVRGLLSLGTMLGFQFITSTMACRFNGHLSWLFQSPPLVIAFRGMMLTEVMKKHRISNTDLNAALRAQNVVNICQVECAIIEPNGTITVFTSKELEDAKVSPDVLLAVPAYKALVDEENGLGGVRPGKTRSEDEEQTPESSKENCACSDMDEAAKKAS